jgi:hypothetical protein
MRSQNQEKRLPEAKAFPDWTRQPTGLGVQTATGPREKHAKQISRRMQQSMAFQQRRHAKTHSRHNS